MDPRSMAPAASSLAFHYTHIAKVIKAVTERYNAAPTTTLSINAECAAISWALMDIQSLLSKAHALSSHVISHFQLEEALRHVENTCSFTISRLEDEVAKCMGNQTTTGESPRTWSMTQLCDEVLIKSLLEHIQRQLTDVNLLITAAQRYLNPQSHTLYVWSMLILFRNSSLEIRQLLQNDTFTGALIDRKDQIDTATSIKSTGYSQSLQKHDPDSKSTYSKSIYSKSIYTQASTNESLLSFHSGHSQPLNPLEGDAASVRYRSQLAPEQSEKTKKVPRAQMGSIFFKLFKSNTELHRAAKKGDAKKIKALLGLGVDINYEGSSGCTALHLATDCGHEAAVRVLLENGADPTIRSSEGRTPLHSAARAGHTAVVRLLLEKDVDLQAKDPSGSTPLHMAAYNGQESVVQILLEKNTSVEERGPSGFTALHVAAFNGQSAVVRQLVEMGANLEARSSTGRTALQLAAEKGHEAVVRHLLQHGANVMAKDTTGRTALQGAVSAQHGAVAQLLLDKAVLPQAIPQWQIQRDSRSGPTYELGAAEPAFKIPELAANEPPGWSRQVSSAPIYELPASSVGVELPVGSLNAGLKSATSTTTLQPYHKRAGGT
jgi:ankyrin repeat protein